MALQTSGAISISQINEELGGASWSLRTLSSLAGKSTPDAMSEFYGYSLPPEPSDEGILIALATEGFESPEESCIFNLNPGTQNMYVQVFEEGMFLYLDSELSEPFIPEGEMFWYINYDGVSYSALIDNAGSASQLSTCK